MMIELCNSKMSSFKTAEGIFLSRGDKHSRECSRKLLTADRNAASTQLQYDMATGRIEEFLQELSLTNRLLLQCQMKYSH